MRSVHFSAFPLYAFIFMFLQIKITCALEWFFPCMFHSPFSFKSKLQQKAVLHSVHLNVFSPVCFILHSSFSFKLRLHLKQCCIVWTWMIFPVSFILCVLYNQNFKSKQFCIAKLNAFPLYVSFFIFFQIQIEQKALLQIVYLNAFSPEWYLLFFWFFLNQNYKSKQCCTRTVCTWMIFPLPVCFG